MPDRAHPIDSHGLRRAARVTLVALALALGPAPEAARAAPRHSIHGASALADDARARMHHAAGERHFRAGRFMRAAGEYERGFEISGRPAFLVNAGTCYARLGRFAEAETRYRRYLALAPEGSARRSEVVRALATLARLRQGPVGDGASMGGAPAANGRSASLEGRLPTPAEAAAGRGRYDGPAVDDRIDVASVEVFGADEPLQVDLDPDSDSSATASLRLLLPRADRSAALPVASGAAATQPPREAGATRARSWLWPAIGGLVAGLAAGTVFALAAREPRRREVEHGTLGTLSR